METSITIQTTKLQELVSKAIKAASMVDVIPLSCLLQVKVANDRLSVSCTDGVNYLTAYAPVMAGDFEIVVPAKLFSQLVSKITSGEKATTKLTIDGNKVVVEANGKYNIPLAVDTDGSLVSFPNPADKFTATSATKHLTLQDVKIILSYNKSCKAIMKEVPELFNYYFDNEVCLTTDCEKGCLHKVSAFDTPTCISPTLMDLVATVCDEDGVDIKTDNEYVLFSSKAGVLYGKKCVQADVDLYPAEHLKTAFTTEYQNSIKLNKTLLVNALDRIGLFTDEMSSNKIVFKFTEDKLTLISDTTGSSESINYPTSDDGSVIDPFTVVLDISGKEFKQMLSSTDIEIIDLSYTENVGMKFTSGNVTMAISVLETIGTNVN